ncbi:MAG: hypothetical protein Q9227_004022 [Pyrenula ochraceoflavens]
MKVGVFTLTAVSLLQLAVAQPHSLSTLKVALQREAESHAGHGRRHELKHAIHEGRDAGVETDFVTVTASEVIIWVDEAGSFVSAETKGIQQTIAAPPKTTSDSSSSSTEPPSTSSTPAPTTSASSSSSSETPPSTTEAPPPPSSEPSSSSSSSAPSSSASSGSGSGAMTGSGKGACYTPYNDDGTCKDSGAISNDLNALSAYPLIRIYGVDCNQVSNVLPVARQKGKQVMLGITTIGNVNGDIGSMIQQVNGDWSGVYAINVGNEVVNGGGNPSDVVNAINTAKGLLKSAGYDGPVVTVDTQNAILSNPSICQASDFPAANIHAFFNANLGGPDQAGSWVLSQAKAVSDACGGRNTLVTESGWPTNGNCGNNNCPNEPGTDNQAKALSSLKSSFSENLLLFSGGSTAWKAKDPGPYGIEAYWAMQSP